MESDAQRNLMDDVAESLTTELGIDSARVLRFSNAQKYSSTPGRPDEISRRVFSRLREINHVGMTTADLCRRSDGLGRSFRECLDAAAMALAHGARGRDVVYVELGPEPIKTRAILQQLQMHARSVVYVGIDINAASQSAMRSEIAPLIGEDGFHYLLRDYTNVRRDDLAIALGRDLGTSLVVVSSLGSQEGNEYPAQIHAVYRSLTAANDFVLSELQLLPEANHAPIFAFSHHPLWRDVSRAFRERVIGDVPSEYGTVLVPLRLEGVGTVCCAIAVERLLAPGCGADIMISNYCLKYSAAQLRRVRSALGFDIVESFETGDGSVCFQVLMSTGGQGR